MSLIAASVHALAVAILIWIGSSMVVTSGGLLGTIIFKVLPIAVAFGLALIAFGVLK